MPNNQPPPPPSQATPSASTTPPRGTNGSQPTLGELIARISENISALVRGEIDLAKAKGQRMAKEMGLGAGLLGAAGVLALFIFGLLLGAMTAALSNVMPLWAAFLVVALILTVIAVPMALIGIKRLKAAPSADAVLSDMAARRLALAADVDELAARLAPHNLAKVAKLKAREQVQDLRSQAVSKVEERVGQVKSRLTSLVGGGTDPNGGVDSYEPGTLTLGQRVTRLFDDARDGDPASLGIVTAAGLALAGLSVTATVDAVKVFRARAGRA